MKIFLGCVDPNGGGRSLGALLHCNSRAEEVEAFDLSIIPEGLWPFVVVTPLSAAPEVDATSCLPSVSLKSS